MQIEIVFLLIVGTVSALISFITFLELQSVKMELESMFFRQQIADVPVQGADDSEETPDVSEETTSIDEQVLTENEIARIQREFEFDQRIKQMKEELANRTADGSRRGTEAEQLHPHVHNLPHNIIADFYDDLPDVEISN